MELQSHLNPLTSDIEQHDLEFVLLGLILALIQYILIMTPFPAFRMVMCILSHCMFELHNLLFFVLKGGASIKRVP